MEAPGLLQPAGMGKRATFETYTVHIFMFSFFLCLLHILLILKSWLCQLMIRGEVSVKWQQGGITQTILTWQRGEEAITVSNK